jgi:hypothetical protein
MVFLGEIPTRRAKVKRTFYDSMAKAGSRCAELSNCGMSNRAASRRFGNLTVPSLRLSAECSLPLLLLTNRPCATCPQRRRVSWRGTASELREVLREVIDYLAPDDKITGASGFRLEQGLTSPTQRQKVRFILRARRRASTAVSAAGTSLDTIEGAVASLARSTYQRGSVSTHLSADSSEIRSLKRYVDTLLGEFLEIRV